MPIPDFKKDKNSKISGRQEAADEPAHEQRWKGAPQASHPCQICWVNEDEKYVYELKYISRIEYIFNQDTSGQLWCANQ